MMGKKSFADIRYLMAVINPLTTKISMQEDLMGMTLKAYKWDVVGRSIFKTGMYDPFLSRWLIDRFEAGGGASSISVPTLVTSHVYLANWPDLPGESYR